MSREQDAQLLESLAVRRNRLRESLLWGRERRLRATTDNLKHLAISIVLAAVACAARLGHYIGRFPDGYANAFPYPRAGDIANLWLVSTIQNLAGDGSDLGRTAHAGSF